MMKALVKDNSGVSVCHMPRPDITSADDVIIRVAVGGLCRTDVEVAMGRIPSKDNVIIGHEFSGIVEKTSVDVAGFNQGDRVGVMPFVTAADDRLPNGRPSYLNAQMLGMHLDGAFCEYIRVPASTVYKMPSNVTFLQGAYLEPIAASMAVLNADIAPHQKGVIFGDNRISRLTERIMRAKGFSGIEVCSKDGDLAANAYDFIIETFADTASVQKMVRALKPGGRLVLKSRQHKPVSVSVHDLVMKDLKIDAVSYGDFKDALDLVASGKLYIDDLFGDVYALEDYQTVFDLAQRGESKKLFFSTAGKDVWNC